jgi:predicted RNA-binding Zn ribbon-like protein
MARLQDVPSEDRRRFRTGRACLDFAHTGGEGERAVWELLHDERDVERWLGVVLDGAAVRARPEDVALVRGVRQAIIALALAAVAGTERDARHVAAVNAAAAAPPLVPQLGAAGVRFEPAGVAAALSTLARDAIDLLGGPFAGRVRECAAENCGLLYVDTSRPGTRRWCSMEVCGNRAKVRAHRA